MKSLRYLNSVIKYCSFENESERVFCTFLFLLRRGGGVFKIVNNLGSLVFFDNIVDHIGKYSKQINLQNNSKGIYFLEIETKDGMINLEEAYEHARDIIATFDPEHIRNIA